MTAPSPDAIRAETVTSTGHDGEELTLGLVGAPAGLAAKNQ